jgi:hypothetical protein
MPAEKTRPVIQVIDADKQHVGGCFFLWLASEQYSQAKQYDWSDMFHFRKKY